MARTSTQRDRLKLWLPTVLVLVSIGLCVSSLIMVVNIYLTPDDNHKTYDGVCIKSDVLNTDYLQTSDGQRFFHRKTDNGKQKYCIRSARHLTEFLFSHQQFLEKSTKENAARQNKPSITDNTDGIPTGDFSLHVPLISSIPLTETGSAPRFDNTSKYPLHLDTEDIGVTGEIIDNFMVLSTGIIIKYTGMYYVYSNVLFDPHSDVKCAEFPIQGREDFPFPATLIYPGFLYKYRFRQPSPKILLTWQHDVIKISPNDRGRSGTILSSRYICCDVCTQQKETSYTGGVFLLEAGDHLHVEVSAFSLMRFDKTASYMGLFMLGDSQ